MSFFGTLGRKGKKVNELKKPNPSLSTSTPNLHQIRVPELTLTSSQGHGSSKDRLENEDEFDSHSLERNPSSDGSISSASTSSTLPRRGRKGGSLRGFWSMVSVNNHRRRQVVNGFGSAAHLAPRSPDPNSSTTTVFYTTQSQSAPNIQGRSGKTRHPGNMEPGVLSGSSSSSSTNSFDTKMCKTEEEVAKDKLMLQGIKKFNQDPKRGVDFLILSGIIQRTPESVAQYLKDGEGLSKSAVGNYLGDHHDFNIQVLKAFVELHDFTDVLLVQALRQFLWSFRLPGEAQKIDRMMESFANRYCHLNPHIFKNPDTCYVLSYAIIMLNTSLHNPNVKDKPTVEQFIRMNRDIDGGDALNTSFIVQLYNSIQAEPFQIPPEDGNDLMLTFFNPDIEGWLWKQGESYKRWKRRWFILSNNCLYYFKFTTDKVPRGIIPLENIVVREERSRQFSFSLRTEDARMEFIKSCKTLSDGQTVQGRHSAYHLATSSQKEKDRWMMAISQNSSTHSFYTFLAQKKRTLTVTSRKSGRTKKPTVRKSQIGVPLKDEFSSRGPSEGPESDNEKSGHSADGSDATSQISFEVRRYSEMDDEQAKQGSSSAKLTRKYSLPGHHRVSRYESMVMPEIRVTTPRDGVGDFRKFSDDVGTDFDEEIRGRAFSESVVRYSAQYESCDIDISERLDQVQIGQKEDNHEKTEIYHEKTEINYEKAGISPEKSENIRQKIRRPRIPKLPPLSLPKFSINEPMDDKPTSTTPTNLPDSEFNIDNSVRYCAQIPETSEIIPSGDTTPYTYEFLSEKVEPRLFEKTIPLEDVATVSEVRRSHRPHFPVRRISTKIKDRHRRRSIDKIKVIHDEMRVRRRNSMDNPSESESIKSPEIKDVNYLKTCQFGSSTSPGEEQIVETYNSVLINSVRHTDV